MRIGHRDRWIDVGILRQLILEKFSRNQILSKYFKYKAGNSLDYTSPIMTGHASLKGHVP
jgi:hypothetical protein